MTRMHWIPVLPVMLLVTEGWGQEPRLAVRPESRSAATQEPRLAVRPEARGAALQEPRLAVRPPTARSQNTRPLGPRAARATDSAAIFALSDTSVGPIDPMAVHLALLDRQHHRLGLEVDNLTLPRPEFVAQSQAPANEGPFPANGATNDTPTVATPLIESPVQPPGIIEAEPDATEHGSQMDGSSAVAHPAPTANMAESCTEESCTGGVDCTSTSCATSALPVGAHHGTSLPHGHRTMTSPNRYTR